MAGFFGPVAGIFKKRWARITAKAIGGLVAALLLLQIILWGGLLWLNGPGGQEWLGARLASLLQPSGYTVTATGLRLSVFGTLHISKLDVADDAGSFLTGDHISLHVSPRLLASRVLSVSASAGAIDLRRLPATAPGEEGGAASPLAGFTLPALYPRHFRLSADILHLVLAEEAAGAEISLAPKLAARADIDGNRVIFDLSIRQKIMNGEGVLSRLLPSKLDAGGSFDTQGLDLDLRRLVAEAWAFRLAASGRLGLGGDDGALDLSATLANDDLAALTDAKLAGRAALDLKLSGTRRAPAIDMKGGLTHMVLNGKSLDDIRILAQSDRPPAGRLSITTSWQQKPVRLDAGFDWQEGVLRIDGLEGHAPEAALAGDGSFDTATGLAAARLEASASLAAYQDILGPGVAGKGALSLALKPQDGRQSVAARASVENFRYGDYRLQKGTLQAALPDAAALLPESADVTLAGLQGNGFSLAALDAGLKRREDKAYALRLKGQLQSPGPLGFNGGADLSGTAANDAAARNIALSITAGGKNVALIAGDILPDKIALKMDAKNLPLSLLPLEMPDNIGAALATGTAEVSGDLAAPAAKAALVFSPLRAHAHAPAVSLRLNAAYAERQLTAEIAGSGKGIDVLKANAALPLVFTLRPFAFALPETAPLQGAAVLKTQLAPLAGAALPPDIRLRGRLDADMRLAGTPARPEAAGSFALSDGRLDQISSGFALRGMAARGAFTSGRIELSSFTATDGEKGSLSARGSLALGGDNEAQLTAALHHMNLLRHNEEASGTLSADLSLAGNSRGYTLKGRVNPDDIYINIPERFTRTVPKLNVIDPRKKRKQGPDLLQRLALNLDIRAADHIFVRGWGLDAEFGGGLDVGGTAALPLVNGTLESKRGRYEEFGKRFSIGHANLRFQGAVPPSPYLDVLAETNTADITAQVALTGPVAKPAIAFTSVPALPQDEVLSHILFGKGMDKISPFQAIQLTRTLQRFSGKGGGPDPLGALRGAARLDDLNVQTDDAGATTVGAGKYITDKVYLEVESGSGKKSGAAKVQMELTPKVKLESKVGQDAQTGAGITWGFDY